MLLCAPVHAQTNTQGSVFFNQLKLATLCLSDKEDDIAGCTYYVLGVQDDISAMRLFGFLNETQIPYCLPLGSQSGEVVEAVRAYLRSQGKPPPAAANVNATIPVLMALIKSFPCSKN
jgi:hypothetical protein